MRKSSRSESVLSASDAAKRCTIRAISGPALAVSRRVFRSDSVQAAPQQLDFGGFIGVRFG